EHEQNREPVAGRTASAFERTWVGAEPPGGEGRKCMGNRSEEVHATEQVPDYAREGEARVYEKQSIGGHAQARGQPVVGYPRRLGRKELSPGNGQLREHSDEYEDDAYTTDPHGQGAPHEHGERERLEVPE